MYCLLVLSSVAIFSHFCRETSVIAIFVSHIPQTPVLVHKADDQFIVIHGGIIKSIEIQRTKNT